MNHQRHAHRFKCRARQFRTVRRRRSGHFVAFHMRKIHARLLEYRAVFQYAGFAHAQLARPFFTRKHRPAVFLLKRGADLVLQVFQYG